jgi:hypothetical protein
MMQSISGRSAICYDPINKARLEVSSRRLGKLRGVEPGVRDRILKSRLRRARRGVKQGGEEIR